MHEWKSNCVSNQFGDIFSTIMSRYSEERVRVQRYFKQNLFGELKKTGASSSCPHIPHHMAHVMHVMYSTLYWSISVPPLSCFSATWHLGSHDLCMFHKNSFISNLTQKAYPSFKCATGIVSISKLFALFILWITEFPNYHTDMSNCPCQFFMKSLTSMFRPFWGPDSLTVHYLFGTNPLSLQDTDFSNRRCCCNFCLGPRGRIRGPSGPVVKHIWIVCTRHMSIPCMELTYPTLGKGKSTQNWLFRGYVRSQEGDICDWIQ